MNNIKTILLCSCLNFHKWAANPRIYTIAAVITAFLAYHLSGLSQLAAATGIPVTPWVFPHLLTLTVLLFFSCLTALLFCDAPFVDYHIPFIVIRAGRRNWVIGQLLYIVLASFIYTAFLCIVSSLVLIPNLQLSNDWGVILKTLAVNPDISANYGIKATVFINKQIVTEFPAIQAMVISFGLFWLTSIFVGVLIFSFNVVIGKMSGLVASGFFIFISYFSYYQGRLTFGSWVSYISPLSWSSMIYLNWNYAGVSCPTPTYSVFCLLAAILLMSLVSLIVVCKKDMDIQGGK